MKRVQNILLAVCMLMACRQPDTEIQKRISGADSMAINFYKGDGTNDTVIAVKIIRDQQRISRLAGFISAAPVDHNYLCGYDGSIHFFK
ncbi:MAG: hypothetical protein WKI04_08535 [Ferruginibacter sp.]